MLFIELTGQNHNPKSEAEIKRLVDDHLYLIDKLTGIWTRRRPLAVLIQSEGAKTSFERSEDAELRSVAMLALVNSAKGYNKQRNNLFATYAGAAIRNALTWNGRSKQGSDSLNVPGRQSLDFGIRDKTDDKERPVPRMTPEERDSDPLPELTLLMLAAIKLCLTTDEFMVWESRLLGDTLDDIAPKLGCTPQNISLIQQRAVAKAEQAIVRLRFPQECRRDAMDTAYSVLQARNPDRTVGQRPRRPRDTNSIEVRQALEFRRKNFWAEQMPGSGHWERQQNRRFFEENGYLELPKLPKLEMSRPRAAPWVENPDKTRPAAIQRRGYLRKRGIDGGVAFDEAVANTIAKSGGWLLVKRVRGGWVASRPPRTVAPSATGQAALEVAA